MFDRSPTLPRRTLARPFSLSGITLFSGASTSITINPATDSGGIRFRRIDLPHQPTIPAAAALVVAAPHHTVLSANPADNSAPSVATVEHILSALAGLGITDALIDVAGPEVPIADGSALPFVRGIQEAGVVLSPNAAGPSVAVVYEPITIVDGKARIEALPPLPSGRQGLDLTYVLEYPTGSPIPAQSASVFIPLGLPAPEYAAQVGPARTFSLEADARRARQAGLFAHLSPRDMLVIGEHGPIDNAYRFDNEPARHKLLDLLGDLALAARPIHARVTATRTGHTHNHAMARALAAL